MQFAPKERFTVFGPTAEWNEAVLFKKQTPPLAQQLKGQLELSLPCLFQIHCKYQFLSLALPSHQQQQLQEDVT